MAVAVAILELSWLTTFLGIVIVILVVAMCVCSRHVEKTPGYGLEGRVSITRDSPILQRHTSNGDAVALRVVNHDSAPEDGVPKRNSWTVKDRALPDIPDSSISIVSTTNVPTIGIDPDTVLTEELNHKKKSHNKPTAPKPPVQETPKQLPESSSESHSKVLVKDKSLSLDNSASFKTSGLGARPRTQHTEGIPSVSGTSVVLKRLENAPDTNESYRRFSDSDTYDTVSNPYAEPQVDRSSSPVCIRIGMPHQIPNRTSPITTASLAVAGAVSSSDIPYMTPPLLHNQLMPDNNESPQRTSSGQHNELPYTVISVREPLARVREMTIRKQQRAVHQNSDESENHYAMVPEEEQMYAEIGSGQDSGSSSITYAHIEPRELPPVPPTVESLKSVAHAHSRQASSVSNSSFGSGVSGSGESSSPPTLRNPSAALYSTVEKSAKQRKTIHIAEGASILSNIEKHKKVEDLYAKVRKKRVELTVSAANSADYTGYQDITGGDTNCITPPPSPWASTTPPAPPPIAGRLQASSLGVLTSLGTQHIRRHSADPNVPERVNEEGQLENPHFSYVSTKESGEPGYEQIYNEETSDDACYEKIKDEVFADDDIPPGYESVHSSDHHAVEISFPGYESVKDINKDLSDPGYECVAQVIGECSLDPGYEPVRLSMNLDDHDSNHGYTSVKLDQEGDPNYETVKKLHSVSSDSADPGYEKVKQLHRNDSDATDPGYERVRNQTTEDGDPGYETVQRSDSDIEPGYETVRLCNDKGSSKCNGPYSKSKLSTDNKISISHGASNSTVLFVPGSSEPNASSNRPLSRGLPKSLIEIEGTATFL